MRGSVSRMARCLLPSRSGKQSVLGQSGTHKRLCSSSSSFACSLSTLNPSVSLTTTFLNRKLGPGISTGSCRQFCDSPPENGETEPCVIVDKLEGLHIMTIGINRPEKRNAVNTEVSEKLKIIFQEFESDPDMYCAVLHGLGGNFCAGYDLEEVSELGEEGNLANKIAEILMDQGPMGPTKMQLTKPVIAAVNGYCVAGGLELAIMCDLRVVEENSKLGFLNRRFGVPLIDGGSVRLPELIGMSRAMDLILTGRLLDPKEAMEIGLANRICSPGTAFGQAVNLAKEIVKFPQDCLRSDMESAKYATYSARTLEEALNFESENAASVLTTEAIEGAKKFIAGWGRSGKFNVNQVSEQEVGEKA